MTLKNANESLDEPIQKKLTSHIFRHTLVSQLAENRVPLKAIMERVDHADIKTATPIYTHVTKKRKANIAEIMENYWFYTPTHIKKPVAQGKNLDTIGFSISYYLTASLRALPALKAGTFDAGIVISSPVLGLRP